MGRRFGPRFDDADHPNLRASFDLLKSKRGRGITGDDQQFCAAILKIAHNAKDALNVFARYGVTMAPVDDPMIADFVANLDRINALAGASPGFVWRLTGEGNDATDIKPDPDDEMMALNMSVWENPQALGAFVYRSDHLGVMRRRHEWFDTFSRY